MSVVNTATQKHAMITQQMHNKTETEKAEIIKHKIHVSKEITFNAHEVLIQAGNGSVPSMIPLKNSTFFSGRLLVNASATLLSVAIDV